MDLQNEEAKQSQWNESVWVYRGGLVSWSSQLNADVNAQVTQNGCCRFRVPHTTTKLCTGEVTIDNNACHRPVCYCLKVTSCPTIQVLTARKNMFLSLHDTFLTK